jgi:hypothetical protein
MPPAENQQVYLKNGRILRFQFIQPEKNNYIFVANFTFNY